jgi:peptidoglycan/xylan/chitin deacetylase (PgdA/CDA1 family)
MSNNVLFYLISGKRKKVFITSEKKSLPILMYHSISESVNPKFKQFTVQPSLFAEQMAYLHQQEYVPITVAQLAAILFRGEGELPPRPVILTFDDGFADFFENALPILKLHNFVATLYVATAFVGRTSSWLKYESEDNRLMLSWEQLKEISMSGIECGAHSHTHPQLDTLFDAVVLDEATQSKKLLEDHLSQKVISFAYPFGYYTSRTRQIICEAGYTCACAVRHKMASESDNPFSLARFMVRPDTNIDTFAAMLIGQNLSFTDALHRAYVRMRTPLWQFVRRFAFPIAGHSKQGDL